MSLGTLASSLLVLVPTVGARPEPAPGEPIGRLVPEGAVVFLRVESVDALASFASDLESWGPGEPLPITAEAALMPLAQAGLDPGRVSREKPFAFAINFPEGVPMPLVTVIVPVEDAAGFLSGWQGPNGETSAVAGDYVGISTVPDYAARDAAAPIATVSGGLLGARAELGLLIEAFRPLIDTGLDQGRTLFADAAQDPDTPFDVSGVMDLYFDWIEDFLDSAETLDLDLSRRGSEVRLEGRLSVKEASPMAGLAAEGGADVAQLAGMVDWHAPVAFLMGADLKDLMEQLGPFLDAAWDVYPEPLASDMRDYMAAFEETWPLFGNAYAGEYEFGGAGLRVAMYGNPPDPDALEAKFAEVLDDWKGGDTFGPTGERAVFEVDGLRAVAHGFRFDWSAFADTLGEDSGAGEIEQLIEMMTSLLGGPDGEFVLASSGGVSTMSWGTDRAFLEDTVRRLKRGGVGEPPADVAWMLSRVAGASPVVAYRMDLGALMGQIAEAMSELVPDLPAEAGEISAPMLFYGAAGDRNWHGGAALDVERFLAWLAAVEGY